MSNYSLPPVTSADGTVITEAELLELDKPILVEFWYRDKKFAALFDPKLVKTQDVLALHAKQAELQRKRLQSGDDMISEAEEIEELIDSVRGLNDADAKELLGDQSWERVMSFTHREALYNAEHTPILFPLRLKMLVPGIVAWNMAAGRAHTVEAVEADGDLARALVPALWNKYRPTSTDSSAVDEAPAETTSETKTAETSGESVTTTPPVEKTDSSTSDS